MTEKWCGSLVSIDCGDVLGIYEGEVISVNPNNQTISLTNVLRNSVKCQVSEVILRSQDIKHLQILRSAANKPKPNTSIGQNQSSAFQQPTSTKKNKNAKVDQSAGEENAKPKSDIKKKNSMKGLGKWQSDRDEACFSNPIDSVVMDTEFDFEKNLALFDKQRVFDEIDAHSKNDSVRLVDCNKRGSQPKYRHDENVLGSRAPVFKQISVPCPSDKEYATDSGLIVPSVTLEFKELLFKKAEEVGFSTEVHIEMVGRAASEMVLQLLGGNHRLNPQNSHQKPTVIILCGAHVQGAQAVNCGRQLANHQVNVTVLCPPLTEKMDRWFTRELGLFSLSGGAKTSSVESSMPSSVDIVVCSLDAHNPKNAIMSSWAKAAKLWAAHSKAPILGVDPTPNCCGLHPKWILSPVLPFSFEDETASVYICDIGLPKGVFHKVGMNYGSPFGSKFVIPLYAAKSA